MKVEQVYDIVNTMTKEVLGEETVVNEDLSNIVDVGIIDFLHGGKPESVQRYVIATAAASEGSSSSTTGRKATSTC